MDLQKLIDKKDAAARYMVTEISYICNKLDKRAPGSKGEHQAAEYAATQMKKLGCDRVFVEEFKENPGSFFGWIYFTISCCFLALISYFILPVLSIVFISECI